MSKSYRKTPFIRQRKEDYRYLNRQIRHDKLAEIPNGSSFKRHRPHWNCWAYIWTWEEAKEQYYNGKYNHWKYQTIEKWYQYWARCALRK